MVSSTHEHRDYLRRSKFATPVTKEDVQREWSRTGHSLEQRTAAPGAALSLPRGAEQRDELLTVAQGELEVGLADEGDVDGEAAIVRVGPGDELFIPRRAGVTVRALGDQPCAYYVGYE